MNNQQSSKLWHFQRNFLGMRIMVTLFLLVSQLEAVSAQESAIKALDFATLAGNKMQLQLEMTGTAIIPKVFQTDNPARIALDFVGVKNALGKKSFTVNKGSTSKVFVVEASGRTRVIVNLLETVPYEIKVVGNKFFLTLKESNLSDTSKQSVKVESVPEVAFVEEEIEADNNISIVTKLLPKQTIKDIDFRRGAAGEGLLVIALTSPNTVVDVKEQAGKVVLKFLNTQLPKVLRKRFDVSDFATPVQKIDAVKKGSNTELAITMADGNYDYSSYQEEGMLTVNFRPMSEAEKEAIQKEKFPFSGDKLTLNFEAIKVTSVLQILADFTDLNIIASDDVSGEVTLRLDDVPWDQALDLILKSKGLSKRKTGNVILVAPTTKIIMLEEEELAAQAIIEKLAPLRTEYIQINYATADDIKDMLIGTGATAAVSTSGAKTETGRLLSDRGIASVDPRTNILIVKDTADKMDEIRKLIDLLDVPIRQVMIEARIVSANKNFSKQIGAKFGIGKSADVNSEKDFGIFGQGLDSAREGFGLDGSDGLVDLATDALNTFPPAALGMTLVRAADYVLNLEISALENENRGELISNPRVLTSDRVTATISQGQQIPYTTVSADGTNTEFIDATLELNVTPQITPNGSVIMELAISNNSPQVSADGTTAINTEEVTTTVQIKDGETVVLGGVYKHSTNNTGEKVPFLGDLPLIGLLFRQKGDSDGKTELLIFVTPKIVKQSLSVR